MPQHWPAGQVRRRRSVSSDAARQCADGSGEERRRARTRGVPTGPITFFVFDRVLVTVHGAASRTIDVVRTRLLEFRNRENGGGSDADRTAVELLDHDVQEFAVSGIKPCIVDLESGQRRSR